MPTPQTIDDLLRRTIEDIAARPRLPESTYRLQFHAGFTFRDASAIVPYLRDLGVTHAYASPYLKATPGSTHGYDVIDHCRLNPEVGTEADYSSWVAALGEHGLSHILDTVPNHVGIGTNDNTWWNDVLSHGPASRYGNFFDIAWQGSPRPELHDKVLLPVLGGPYGDVLEKGELRLAWENGRFAVAYYDRRFPISPDTYELILDDRKLPGDEDGPARELIEKAVAHLNGTPGDPRSFDRLDDLLQRQSYRLAYWRTAPDEINYRRFFDINDLAALRMEREEVFGATHAFTLHLLAERKVAGLRVDHPDGLFDPEEYFLRLQRHYVLAVARSLFVAEESWRGRDWSEIEPVLREQINAMTWGGTLLYVAAEKILAADEPLPREWVVNGTSGYDFLNKVNGLFVCGESEQAFTSTYREWAGGETSFADLAYQKKRLILHISLASELNMLAHELDRLAQKDRHSRDFTLDGLRHGLRELIACFPVYRSYISDRGVRAADRPYIESAVADAVGRNPKTDPSVFHFIRDALLLKYPDRFTESDRAALRHFAGKFQQVTAPVTAKGIEDTAFYVYNRLTSLNEVGGDPDRFGVLPAALHDYFRDRQAHWPYALSCLSTHDTKRSEDVRARLNVLSEIPEEWRQCVRRWGKLNEPHRQAIDSGPAPDRNEEYLLYQALIGAWPLEPCGAEEFAAFVKRIGQYMQKAMREAKVNTSWTEPDAKYEGAVRQFIERILDEGMAAPFLKDFRAFQGPISHWGLFNSLSQTLLRLVAPGVPDTYQGTELWDFSLVDPDNRRPVDYARRRQMLADLSARVRTAGSDRTDLARDLVQKKEEGGIKLYVTWQTLSCRRDRPGLFSAGEYLPAEPTGPRRDHLFGFARRLGGQWALALVPHAFTHLAAHPGDLPLGREVWQDTMLAVPGSDPGVRLRNVFTGERVIATVEGGSLQIRAAEAFAHFPVALLVSENEDVKS